MLESRQALPDREKPGWQRHAALLFLMFAGVLVTYFGVFTTSYGKADDVSYLRLAANPLRSEWVTFARNGRPLYFIIEPALRCVGNIGDLRYLRLVSILGVAFLSWGLYGAFVSTGRLAASSALMAVLVVLTVPFQVFVSWAVTFPYAYACFLTFVAVQVADRAYRQPGGPRRWVGAALGSLLTLSALMFHQSAGMFVWVFLAIHLFGRRENENRPLSSIAWHLGVIFAACALEFVAIKIGAVAYGHSPRTQIELNLLEKGRWFLLTVLPRSLHFVYVKSVPSVWVAVSVGAIILVGLLRYFMITKRHWFGYCFLALAFIPLSYTPNLLAKENWSSYRSQVALISLLAVYAFFALEGIIATAVRWLKMDRSVPRITTACLLPLVLLAALQASTNVNLRVARPACLEFQLIRRYLIEADLDQVKSIFLIQPGWSHIPVPPAVFEEFGVPTTCQPWGPEAVVYLLLREIAVGKTGLPFAQVGAEEMAKKDIQPPEGALVIDMRKLVLYRGTF